MEGGYVGGRVASPLLIAPEGDLTKVEWERRRARGSNF